MVVVVVLKIVNFNFVICYRVDLVDDFIDRGMYYIVWLLHLYLFWYEYDVLKWSLESNFLISLNQICGGGLEGEWGGFGTRLG